MMGDRVFGCSWSFTIQDDETDDLFVDSTNVPEDLVESYRRDGFVIFANVLSVKFVDRLNLRLEEILRGRYDRGRPPDKVPRLLKTEFQKLPEIESTRSKNSRNSSDNEKGLFASDRRHRVGPLGFSGNLQNVKVQQIINVHKADDLFHRLSCSHILGKVVAQLAGWEHGARLAQDQVWAKPPGAPPLTFHRDSPYFMFTPDDVVTVWVALDDMTAEIGPLEYVRGSHRWGQGRIGSSNQFFHSKAGRNLLKSAAEREGISEEEIEIISMAGLLAGGISIHDGRTWHGSGKNESTTKPRRGLGLHFVPAHVQFNSEAVKSRLWRPYVINCDDPSMIVLPEEDFPIVWQPV